MPERTFDVIVIGAGPTGENAADYAVRAGMSAALVESERFGGECSFWACIPSKALLRTGHAVAAARRLPGVTAEFDPAAVLARRDAFTHDWDDSSQAEWARAAEITAIRGHGRLAGPKAVQVDGPDGGLLRARHAVVVASGSVPVRPPIPGLDTVRYWGSREATSAKEVPRRLGVLGGGVVGSEMAQAFARLGSHVVLLNRGPRLLPSAEPMAGERVAAAFRADGIDLRLEQGLDEVFAGPDGSVLLRVGAETIEVDELLVATGRRPNTTDIGLSSVGLEPGMPLPADDSGLVAGVEGEWLYAAGDVTGRAPVTHQGKYAARIVGAAIAARSIGEPLDTATWGEHAATADHAAVPQVVFTDPEVAFVGCTEHRALDEGIRVRAIELELTVAGAFLQADNYAGAARMVVDADREVLVGATFVGQDVAEMLHAATIAVVGEVPLARLWHAVPAFPTMSEIWLRLLETYRSS
ncbi:dihydrolipoyl dehydrogenase family protein [Pseudonocardia asaccharolytica]|uniref:Dihydrolipoamide dehydrogenase n=1 Tax=Pseudonocardia asaccharolytica DSM 44247 = NBRC 16224 TaxID=1123024 RepID=A0A511CV56_9PSEU|nr:NAD(P)/FAD-dependent oxidoreductase [Pseudonocardia asaccharolytica]GEL16431.1 dihydrolipoamide dehydrogenase [Pseudonocardia asaccharolytica DSM 44247 = NBRC 16224]